MKPAKQKVAETSAREKLVQAAIDLFTSRGYAATSVREIVEAAGVTKPALYYHFESKEGIYLAILQHIQKLMEEGIAAYHSEGGSVRHRIERFLLGLFDLFEKHKADARFLNAAFWGPAQGAPSFDFDSMHHRLMGVVTGMVKEGIAGGELRRSADPDQAAFVIMGILSFSMDLTLAHPELGRGKAGLRRALDLIFKGVAAAAPKHLESSR
jgi:TetR/AcrR family transcriptional regulator